MPKPQLPVYRKIDGDVGKSLDGVRTAIAGVLDQNHLFGNHVVVTFPAPSTSVKVTTGLRGQVSGYRVEKASADVRVFDGAPPTGITVNNGECWLQATAATTVTLYIY